MLGAHSRRFGLWSRVEGPESFRGPSSKRGLSISALSCIRISQRGAETRKGGESGLPSSRTRKKLAHLQVNFSLGSEARRRIGGAGFPVGGKESGGEQDSEEAGRRRGGEGSEGLSWGGTGEISGDAFKEWGMRAWVCEKAIIFRRALRGNRSLGSVCDCQSASFGFSRPSGLWASCRVILEIQIRCPSELLVKHNLLLGTFYNYKILFLRLRGLICDWLFSAILENMERRCPFFHWGINREIVLYLLKFWIEEETTLTDYLITYSLSSELNLEVFFFP